MYFISQLKEKNTLIHYYHDIIVALWSHNTLNTHSHRCGDEIIILLLMWNSIYIIQSY